MKKEPADGHRERGALIQAFRQAGGNETVGILDVRRVTVWKRIKKYDIELNGGIRGG